MNGRGLFPNLGRGGLRCRVQQYRALRCPAVEYETSSEQATEETPLKPDVDKSPAAGQAASRPDTLSLNRERPLPERVKQFESLLKEAVDALPGVIDQENQGRWAAKIKQSAESAKQMLSRGTPLNKAEQEELHKIIDAAYRQPAGGGASIADLIRWKRDYCHIQARQQSDTSYLIELPDRDFDHCARIQACGPCGEFSICQRGRTANGRLYEVNITPGAEVSVYAYTKGSSSPEQLKLPPPAGISAKDVELPSPVIAQEQPPPVEPPKPVLEPAQVPGPGSGTTTKPSNDLPEKTPGADDPPVDAAKTPLVKTKEKEDTSPAGVLELIGKAKPGLEQLLKIRKELGDELSNLKDAVEQRQATKKAVDEDVEKAISALPEQEKDPEKRAKKRLEFANKRLAEAKSLSRLELARAETDINCQLVDQIIAEERAIREAEKTQAAEQLEKLKERISKQPPQVKDFLEQAVNTAQGQFGVFFRTAKNNPSVEVLITKQEQDLVVRFTGPAGERYFALSFADLDDRLKTLQQKKKPEEITLTDVLEERREEVYDPAANNGAGGWVKRKGNKP